MNKITVSFSSNCEFRLFLWYLPPFISNASKNLFPWNYFTFQCTWHFKVISVDSKLGEHRPFMTSYTKSIGCVLMDTWVDMVSQAISTTFYTFFLKLYYYTTVSGLIYFIILLFFGGWSKRRTHFCERQSLSIVALLMHNVPLLLTLSKD